MGAEIRSHFAIEEYDYRLPSDLIAQTPSPRREASRLLVFDRRRNRIEHRRFEEILGYLRPGDVLVVNDTRVVRARLTGRKETGGKIELLVLDPYKNPAEGEECACLVKAAKPVRCGQTIFCGKGVAAEVIEAPGEGRAQIVFRGGGSLLEILEDIGSVPLPPYIRREAESGGPSANGDASAYQTVYAGRPGAVAAPTAGLHFSRELLEKIELHGVEVVTVTLHVGYGTFAPLRVEDIREHRMHAEYAEISPDAANRIGKARAEGRRVAAVGTTSVRILEWSALSSGSVQPFSGLCNHYIYPGYRFSVVDAMITNFHLPKSTLLLLVSAFAGREAILGAYAEAVREEYRFFSYGDAMLIL